MSSQRQIEANRKNALKSTGPGSGTGKAMVSRNAIKHGIFARDLVITKGDGQEDVDEYQALLANLVNDLLPEGQMEMLLTEKIAINYWRMRRLLRYETGEIRAQLDNFMQNAVEEYYDDTYSSMFETQLKRPEMKYYQYGDTISESELNAASNRVAALDSTEFDLEKDDEALRYVMLNRLDFNAERPGQGEYKKAKAYINALSPQLKGKLRRELLNEAEQIVEEMLEVRKWNARFERLALIKSIPAEVDLNKITKYENSLERSILRNLTTLKAMQAQRFKKLQQDSSELGDDD